MDLLQKCWECSSRKGVDTFFPVKDFETHNSVSHTDCNFKCSMCLNKCITAENLALHKLIDHEKSVCLECYQKKGIQLLFPTEKLGGHYRTDHRFLKVKCDSCPNKFQLESTLEEHKKIFHRPKPVPAVIRCLNCPNYTGDRAGLDRHNARRHNRKSFPYSCSVCGNVFKESAKCEVHNRECNLATAKSTAKSATSGND